MAVVRTILDRLPIDIVYDVSMLCGTYSDYESVSEVVPNLGTPQINNKALEQLKEVRTVRKDVDGNVRTMTLLDGKLHSFDGKPALIDTFYGLKVWFKHGVFHREHNLPAHVHTYVHGEYKMYYIDGVQYVPDKWTHRVLCGIIGVSLLTVLWKVTGR